jgi:hypothetical protein
MHDFEGETIENRSSRRSTEIVPMGTLWLFTIKPWSFALAMVAFSGVNCPAFRTVWNRARPSRAELKPSALLGKGACQRRYPPSSRPVVEPRDPNATLN